MQMQISRGGEVTKVLAAVFLLVTALERLQGASDLPAVTKEVKAALATITTNDLVRHTQVLASDDFEGRAPGTAGENRTIEYLVSELKRLGLKPGNPDGTYIQNVPLAGFTSVPTVSFVAGDKLLELAV